MIIFWVCCCVFVLSCSWVCFRSLKRIRNRKKESKKKTKEMKSRKEERKEERQRSPILYWQRSTVPSYASKKFNWSLSIKQYHRLHHVIKCLFFNLVVCMSNSIPKIPFFLSILFYLFCFVLFSFSLINTLSLSFSTNEFGLLRLPFFFFSFCGFFPLFYSFFG